VDEAVARMETVARQADCVHFCEAYGAHDIFPLNIPYDFAVAYQALALAQIDDHTKAIEGEVQKMLRGEWVPEILGIEEPLMEVLGALEL